jgi:hypothetical protein
MAISEVMRVDAQYELDVVESPHGFITTVGTIAAAGIMTYERADGSTYRELVTDDVLQDPDYLAGHAGLPYIDEHPKPPHKLHMRPEEVGVVRPLCGSVGAAYYDHADQKLKCPIYITTGHGIKIYKEGKRFLSPAYKAQVDDTPGVHPVHGPYDTRQVKRVAPNHVAGCGDPRGGQGMKLKYKADSKSVGVQLLDRADNETAVPPAPAVPPAAPAPDGDVMGKLLALLTKMDAKLDALGTVKPKADEGDDLNEEDAPMVKADSATITRLTEELVEIQQVAKRMNVELPAGKTNAHHKRELLKVRYPERIKADSHPEAINALWGVFLGEQSEAPDDGEWKKLGVRMFGATQTRADSQTQTRTAATPKGIPSLDELGDE